jgi:hypothetical protein
MISDSSDAGVKRRYRLSGSLPEASSRPCLRRNPQARDGRREHLVVADQHHQLDAFAVVEMLAKTAPRRVIEVLAIVHHVHGIKNGLLTITPTTGSGTDADSLDVSRGHTGSAADPDVVAELIRALAEMSDPQDRELGVPPRQHATRHHSASEAQPAAE